MRAYLSALGPMDGRALLAAYLQDLLGDAVALIHHPDGSRVAEMPDIPADLLRVPVHARRALESLARVATDLDVADWLAASAAIISPLAVPENRKKTDKRRKNDYG
jgi:hypothetical protein